MSSLHEIDLNIDFQPSTVVFLVCLSSGLIKSCSYFERLSALTVGAIFAFTSEVRKLIMAIFKRQAGMWSQNLTFLFWKESRLKRKSKW
jgi:hypothetical protein